MQTSILAMSVTDDFEDIFGTSEPPEALSAHACGPLSFRLGETSARGIAWRGVELVQAVDYPVRDANWGTIPTRTISSERVPQTDAIRCTREFETVDGNIAGRFELKADADAHVTLTLRFEIKRDMRLCRVGFTLLRPISGLAGQSMTLRRADGNMIEAAFPQDISPSQPVADFVAISYAIRGVSVDVEMHGQPFEMEDQRNWSDASYKAYPCTASFPEAYPLKAGDIIEESLHLKFAGDPPRAAQDATLPTLKAERPTTTETFPELALAMCQAWSPTRLPKPLEPHRRIVRLDLRDEKSFLQFDISEMAHRAYFDLELVLSEDRRELTRQLEHIATQLAQLGVSPDHVIALPVAYLKSYQPKGPWPDGATSIDAARAARRAFPSARIGGGVLTNFTELNRCRPDPSEIDYLTHGSSAIVHAGDDESVFQTLGALPDIFRSARRIAPKAAYRLGLVSIGMRENPYRAKLATNIERLRRTTCAEDLRAQALFGAAWLVGVAAATEGSGVESLTLASVGGPFRADTETMRLAPSFHVLAWMARMQARRRLAMAIEDGHIQAVATEHDRGVLALLANGAPVSKTVACPVEGQCALLCASTVKAASSEIRIGRSAPRARSLTSLRCRPIPSRFSIPCRHQETQDEYRAHRSRLSH
jgi:hypothetical protein